MVHDDTTYMDDEGLPYVDPRQDGGAESSEADEGAPGRRWGYSEESWGGWAAAE
ncbi:hypothetical protein MXAN_0287 [Myxococcus xanthus DK 1622]|uniref:Uncharacterized protein n=1 Tax=Myxococcus xanthus (strain DK1622) TaxID=246197 RepID=Q1DFK6_MYXXD|nr:MULTISPECIES: hypothetical protein [Myxococcus]ABF88571.1 hypothetical protein MXAN_0287 [Myxococcus xanthus DK 1622]NOJ56738.1 hypothetical protein [Myxococcus xanthus]QPM80010.1 hypothetical protein I5Q59_01515 [Myxococcus xanthus]QVW69074.1 hypothetical protein JTM82_05805 [Myxococcus xanthus DZ2]QZZ47846.1 hypothetical protein MyxoNM_01425 [Myxococcus xanthus]